MAHGGIYLRQKRNFCPLTVSTVAVVFVVFMGVLVNSLGGVAVAADSGGVRQTPSETGSSGGQQEAVGTTEDYVNSSAMGGGQGDSLAEDDTTSDAAEGDVDPFPALANEGKSEARGPSLEERIEEQGTRRRYSSVQEPQAKVPSKRTQKRHRLIGAVVLAVSVAMLTAFFLRRTGRRSPQEPSGGGGGNDAGNNAGNGGNEGRGEGGEDDRRPLHPGSVNEFDF
ncbi:dense granule protein GRA6 [Toxoplasma gondii TgCatPRC2]|uniref:Dense granule antigen n=13 Tax=Toxoplasma gondii TaxID=5811 RepID=Q25C72_TOXGO|nr:dense granule protein GRA6 [Toxoplasma gondii ME49]AAF60335.1 granule antigen protein GRA6 [Toxoplasma gondii]KFG36277.1 dense granule protein GRA6 [Toxoplasma gondii GAB2-2007-GAL-DOM2]KYK63040.1 dense granule protein GRA6 [Toxoplasma gondii TgCatPRC2]AAF60336.1 granule antigen protein GRA6 [Toxoplasma gondii]ABP01602.1 dense granule antigen GRA6 [Toxoplasma gondii]|eukprot:XP_002371939.1 dense granule protein GRA6 [Toxoplasma gondii ME49]